MAVISRGQSNAVVSHYDVQPVIDIFASTHERDLGAVAGDIDDHPEAPRDEAPAGSTVVLRGQVSTMTAAYAQLFGGLALAMFLFIC